MKKWLSMFLVTTLTLGMMSGCASDAKPQPVDTRPILDGATLVTFGDSLTALSTWPQDTAKALNMNLVNAGIGAHHTDHGIARLERDVLSKNPDFVIICFGSNDFYRPNGQPQVALDTYSANLKTFIEKIREKNAVPILMTPPFISEGASGGPSRYPEGTVNGALDTYVEAMRTVAAETNTDLIDIHKICDDGQDPSLFLIADGVHLSGLANIIYTETITAYMREHFRQNGTAPRVTVPTAPPAQSGAYTKSILSFDPAKWLVVFDDTINITAEKSGAISFANTTGQWPEAHYSPRPEEMIAVPVKGSYLTVKADLKASTNLMLFFNGPTPTLAYENTYLSLTSALQKAQSNLRVSGDDINANQTIDCTLDLESLIPAEYIREDGTVLFSGVKVFVIGAKNKKVTIHELSVTTTA